MMRGLLFQNEHTLWVAITSSLLPSEVLASPVQASVSKEGALTVVPSVNLPKKVLTQLQELGVRDSAAKPTRSASCWAELLSVERTTDPESDHTQVLFVLPSDQSLLALAGEMLRLGCDKQEYRISDKQFFLRVTAPPYYTLTKALDRVDGLRAFIPSPRGQDRIWVEIGYRHPLTSLLRPAKGNFLLVTSDGDFVPHAEGGFQDLYQLIDLVVPAREVQAVLKPLKSRIQVPLRFSHSGTLETPTLWVLKENAIEQIDAMLQSLPEIVTGTLLFSAARIDNDDVIVLRVRPGIKRPPQLEVRGEAFAVHPLISNLFVPTGVTLEPPLRRDRVRDLLAPKPDAISWLWPLNRTDFRVESIIEKSFAPLEQWLDYVIHGGAQELAPWVQSTVFAWDEFEAVSGEFVASSKKEEKERKPKKEEKPTRESKDSVQEKPAAQVDPKSKVENKRKEPPPCRDRCGSQRRKCASHGQ